MTGTQLGAPCWYELNTPDLDAAEAFYGRIIGWSVGSAGMDGFDYRLGQIDGSMVAGLMSLPDIPPCWTLYFATPDCDATAQAAKVAGGKIFKAPEDIPGVGRFAVLADPQGAVFALLQPTPGSEGSAFNQAKTGHGNWHELYTPDPEGALAFYGKLFGWTESRRMDMGPMGFYHILHHDGADIGGVFNPGEGVPPHWLPYFGVPGAEAAAAAIPAAGGSVTRGMMEVPGGAYVVQGTDPQGAHFAVVGPK